MSDHGFEKFPKAYASEREAAALFARRQELTDEEREKLFGALLVWLTKEYKKRDIAMQLHFAVIRDNHREMFPVCGKDAGFDLIGEPQSVKDLVAYFDRVSDNERPETILYTLNDENLRSIAAVTGAFRHVRMGAAWWFNDTLQGIKRNLETIGEYSALGNNLGMLTDSRSFSSYCRFDFFRRILCDHVGDKTERGEYDLSSAQTLVKNICYDNAKRMVFHE
jgi:glucuronate isomerase